MKIYVENKKTFDKSRHPNAYIEYIGRPSILGNPFKEGADGNRNAVINMYKNYFTEWMGIDGQIRTRIYQLLDIWKEKDIVLLCWCKPKKCHGDYIKEFMEHMV